MAEHSTPVRPTRVTFDPLPSIPQPDPPEALVLRDFHPFTSVFAVLLLACLFVIVGGSTCCSVSNEGERTTWALTLSQHDNLAAERDVADIVPAQAERPRHQIGFDRLAVAGQT